jgi:hypothetical protein
MIEDEFYNTLYRFIREDIKNHQNTQFKSYAKIVSYLTNLTESPYKNPNTSKEIQKFKNNKPLMKNINKFIKCHNQSNNER